MQNNYFEMITEHKKLAIGVLISHLFLAGGAFAQTQPAAKPAAPSTNAAESPANKPASKPASQTTIKAAQKPAQKTDESKNMTTEQTQTNLPLFYQKLELLDTQKHKTLAVAKELNDFGYASKANVIPVVMTELSFAAKHYPLVFVAEQGAPTPTLVAMVGLGDNKNIFVDAKGKWKAGVYVPAWVRRYPFLTVKADDKRDAIAFDPTSKLFASKSNLPLFNDNEPTDTLKRIVAMQNEFNAAFEKTSAMAAALMSAGVLEPATLTVGSAGKDKAERNIAGFLVVNEAKLRALDNAAIGKLHQSNAIGLAYAQLLSMVNLQTLSETK